MEQVVLVLYDDWLNWLAIVAGLPVMDQISFVRSPSMGECGAAKRGVG